MKKRGQLTLMIILAIILIAVIIIIILISQRASERPLDIQSQALSVTEQYKSAINFEIESCLKSISATTIREIGLRGGYIIWPDNSLETNFGRIAYGYYEGKSTFPTIEEIQEEISKEVVYKLPLCTKFFDDPQIEEQEPTIKTTILDEEVKVEANYPIKVNLNSTVLEINQNNVASIKARLGLLHKIATEIIQTQVETQQINYILPKNYDFFVQIQVLDDTTAVYVLQDEKSNIAGDPYLFMFANKYTEAEELF